MPPRPAPTDPDPFRRLVAIMERLLEPDGCPWDREQTHETLKPYVIEEAYEVCEAIDDNDMDGLREELGDLALQVVFHAALEHRHGRFSIDDVLSDICTKLVRRHPHVFGDVQVSGSGEVLQNWEQIKRAEKQAKAETKAREKEPHGLSAEGNHGTVQETPVASVLDGVPRALPALTRATRVQEKAARVGFDWDRIDDVWKKVEEEIRELREASDQANPKKVSEEFGDLLFALVNVCRFLDIHPEESLQGTVNKFIRRFRHIEKRVHQDKQDLASMSLEEMDKLWDEAKNLERP
jgi:tetrapyrrole methylase family protein/MazG family protein